MAFDQCNTGVESMCQRLNVATKQAMVWLKYIQPVDYLRTLWPKDDD